MCPFPPPSLAHSVPLSLASTRPHGNFRVFPESRSHSDKNASHLSSRTPALYIVRGMLALTAAAGASWVLGAHTSTMTMTATRVNMHSTMQAATTSTLDKATIGLDMEEMSGVVVPTASTSGRQFSKAMPKPSKSASPGLGGRTFQQFLAERKLAQVVPFLRKVALHRVFIRAFPPKPAKRSPGLGGLSFEDYVLSRRIPSTLGSVDASMASAIASTATTGSMSMFVDEAGMLASAAFAISPDELIEKTKTFLASRGGFGADPALMADSFQFAGPVVGPLSKEAFVSAIGSVDIKGGFPDFQGEFYGFHVDPFEANRVWYTARGRGTNTGPLPPFAPTATGREVVNPPQACSLTFNEDGLVTKYTIGYVMDRHVGNTGGLGGLYGIMYAIGKPLPFPEARPWKMSKRYRLFNALGNFLSSRQRKQADAAQP